VRETVVPAKGLRELNSGKKKKNPRPRREGRLSVETTLRFPRRSRAGQKRNDIESVVVVAFQSEREGEGFSIGTSSTTTRPSGPFKPVRTRE